MNPAGMNSSNSTNIAFLQNALKNLEDRYKKLQNRTESLQSENERLVSSRTELMVEVERLQDQQIRLRERNLRLTQEFHFKQQECSLLAEKLTLFARGRVATGFPNSGPGSFKSGLTEVQEDVEGSSDSLVTVELHGAAVPSHSKNLNVTSRTWSEPNLSVIQRELELVRKGLWSPSMENSKGSSTIEDLSSKIISSLKKGQSELEEQFSKMVEIQKNSIVGVEELTNLTDVDNGDFSDEDDSVAYIHQFTRTAIALQSKLQMQNQVLRKVHQILKMPRASEPIAASVVTQTSFNMHVQDSINSSVWRNMQTDRICPLCETVFSTVISQEEFEDHVMEHFMSEDPVLPDFEILAP